MGRKYRVRVTSEITFETAAKDEAEAVQKAKDFVDRVSLPLVITVEEIKQCESD
jgi:hypothetical protein